MQNNNVCLTLSQDSQFWGMFICMKLHFYILLYMKKGCLQYLVLKSLPEERLHAPRCEAIGSASRRG